MKSIFNKVSKNKSTPKYIVGELDEESGRFIVDKYDCYDIITKSPSLEKALKKIKKIQTVSLSQKDICYIYLSKKKIETEEDINCLKSIFGDDISELEYSDEVSDIKSQIEVFKERKTEYERMISIFSEIKGLPYEIVELINVKRYIMKDSEREIITLSKMVPYFNMFEPNEYVQIIILCTSDKSLVYKGNKNSPIKNIDKILNHDFKENTINMFYETMKTKHYEIKRAILDFETGTCNIEVPIKKKNDDTVFYVKKIIEDVITLTEDVQTNTISGELDIKGVGNIPYDEFYRFLVKRSTEENLFFVDESKIPWCATKKYFKVLFFDPLSFVLEGFTTSNFPYATIKIGSKYKDSRCVVKFNSKNLDVIYNMSIYFSKIVSIFFDKTEAPTVSNYQKAFFSTVFDQFKQKAMALIETTSAERSGSSSYATICTGDRKPIIVEDDEVEDYESFGREVESYTFDGINYNFVCMGDKFPKVEMIKAQVVVKSGNTLFPCCSNKKLSKKNTNVSKSNKIRKVSSIKPFDNISNIESSDISDFLKSSFSKDMESTPFLVGTCFPKGDFFNSINDSLIGAMILSQEQENFQYEIPENYEEFNEICQNVRRRLMRLPYEIFAQELFDVSYETFCLNMEDPDHYIDPYLYYRGLEILFDVNIFVFCSRIEKRKNPSSLEESFMEIPTMEIPRCSQYHTRRINKNKRTVLIFKNFGADRAKKSVASNELIAISTDGSKEMCIYSFENKMFNNKIYDYFENACNPILFDLRDNLSVFSNVFVDWDPNELGFGKLKGQELNIYGKTELLIYKKWNITIPAVQPFMLSEIPESHIEYEGIPNYEEFNITYERAKLKTIEECCELFDVTKIDSDGVWIEFQGIRQGIKILCKRNEQEQIKYSHIEQLIQDENNISALCQLINWLWRSDETEENGLPDFKTWIDEKTLICEHSDDVSPLKCLNNLYLPEYENSRKRMHFCNSIWPIFFSDNKILLPKTLLKRITNLMSVQDNYTRVLLLDDSKSKIPNFITGLKPTEADYYRYDSIIFTKESQLKDWVNFTNRGRISHVSISNMNIIHTKIYDAMSSYVNPYLFKDNIGKIYLIQNVLSSSSKKEISISIAHIWSKTKVNMGPYYKSLSDIRNPPFVIFKPTDDNIVVPSISKNISDLEYLCIFNYKNGCFAAMLPLL